MTLMVRDIDRKPGDPLWSPGVLNFSLLADVSPQRYTTGPRGGGPGGADRWLTPDVDSWAPDRILRRVADEVTRRAEARGEDPDGSWWASVAENTFYAVEAVVDALGTQASWPGDVMDRMDLIGALLDVVEAERGQS